MVRTWAAEQETGPCRYQALVRECERNMPKKIRVAILDDHQSIIDGYNYRLCQVPEIEVVATANTGVELDQLLEKHLPDVLLLDVYVPVSATDSSPFPILSVIPQTRQAYPSLVILVISMYAQRGLIKAILEVGANGYILKDDQAAIQNLGNIILSVARGGLYVSKKVQELLARQTMQGLLLTTRQLEVLSLFMANPELTSAAVAVQLDVSNSTVRNLLSGAYTRLGVRSRTAAIAKAQKLGLLASDPGLTTGELSSS